jgi:UPF0271 protein
MLGIDLNVDVGESFGQWLLANEAELIQAGVSSVNIACGFHAGDPGVMRRTVELAIQADVAIGAHPGLPDLQGFGRRVMTISANEAYDMTLYQIGALDAFVRAAGSRLRHVKPHGALYHMASEQRELAQAVVAAIAALDPGCDLCVFAPAGSQLAAAAARQSLRVVREAFADRAYGPDGNLRGRKLAGAVISDAAEAAGQALEIVQRQRVSVFGEQGFVDVEADTICVHGDQPEALMIIKAIKNQFQQQNIAIRAPYRA